MEPFPQLFRLLVCLFGLQPHLCHCEIEERFVRLCRVLLAKRGEVHDSQSQFDGMFLLRPWSAEGRRCILGAFCEVLVSWGPCLYDSVLRPSLG